MTCDLKMKRYSEEYLFMIIKVDLPGKNNNNGEKDSLCNIITCNGFLNVVDPLSPRSDEHVTSPHKYAHIQQINDENTQT